MENKLNIQLMDNYIKELKHPVLFLFKLSYYEDNIEIYDLDIILRLFIKYHSNILLNYNIRDIFPDSDAITDFYKLLREKIELLLLIKKLKSMYKNRDFWRLNNSDKIQYLYEKQLYFKSIFDCAKGGMPYHLKLYNILTSNKSDRDYILTDLEDRLEKILSIFKERIFKSFDIPLITKEFLYTLENENIIKYLKAIFEKFSVLLEKTINLFELYGILTLKIENLLNPSNIEINNKIIDSETDNDDIKFLC